VKKARGLFANGRTGEVVWFDAGETPEVSLKRLAAAGADPDTIAALSGSTGVIKSRNEPTLEDELAELHQIVSALVEVLEDGIPLNAVDKARARFLIEECAKEHARLVPRVKASEKRSPGLGLITF
jgi:hypothetical protein